MERRLQRSEEVLINLPQLKGLGLESAVCKSKPIGKFMLFALQVAEPVQIVYLGGSNIAWVRFMAETHHNFGHSHIRMSGNPEKTMTVMADEAFLKGKGR